MIFEMFRDFKENKINDLIMSKIEAHKNKFNVAIMANLLIGAAIIIWYFIQLALGGSK